MTWLTLRSFSSTPRVTEVSLVSVEPPAPLDRLDSAEQTDPLEMMELRYDRTVYPFHQYKTLCH